jgi:hypothetical protein
MKQKINWGQKGYNTIFAPASLPISKADCPPVFLAPYPFFSCGYSRTVFKYALSPLLGKNYIWRSSAKIV